MTRATLLLTAGMLMAGCANLQRINEKTLVRARQRAARRSRQLVFNNDGDDHILAKDASIEGFLANRSSALEGSQVSTIVYCTSRPFGMFTHDTKVGEVLTQRSINSRRNIVADLIEQGTDPLHAMVGDTAAALQAYEWYLVFREQANGPWLLQLDSVRAEYLALTGGLPDSAGP